MELHIKEVRIEPVSDKNMAVRQECKAINSTWINTSSPKYFRTIPLTELFFLSCKLSYCSFFCCRMSIKRIQIRVGGWRHSMSTRKASPTEQWSRTGMDEHFIFQKPCSNDDIMFLCCRGQLCMSKSWFSIPPLAPGT